MIRAIQEEDIAKVLPLLELMYNVHQVEIPFFMPKLENVAVLEERLRIIMKKDGFFQYIYIHEEKIVGYCDLSIYEGHMDLLFPSNASIILDTLIIDPQYRGLHFATEMIDFAKNIARQKGFSSLGLQVLTSFPNVANYYQKLGFKTLSTNMLFNLEGDL